MARDAIARLYDVDEDSLEFKRLRLTNRYDQATVMFRTRNGGLIDLGKLHESLWATRLSGGTSSGVVWLQVTAEGGVVLAEDDVRLNVRESDRQFILVDDVSAKPEEATSAFAAMREAVKRGEQIVSITGYVDGWVGRWPGVLQNPPPMTPRLMVASFETAGGQSE